MFIINLIISVCFFSCSLHAQYACNGYPELCNRKFNQVAFIHTHNASSNTTSPVSNQDQSITQQLNDGIRAMKVPVYNNYGDLLGYYSDALTNYKNILVKILNIEQNPQKALVTLELDAVNVALACIKETASNPADLTIEPYACHGLAKSQFYEDYVAQLINQAPESIKPLLTRMQKPLTELENSIREQFFGQESQMGGIFPYPVCLLDTGRKSLVDIFTEISDFLITHPHEVLMLTLEDHDNVDFSKVQNALLASGLQLFLHAQNNSLPWPTLGEMVESGKRMVLFTTSDVQKQYPFLNYYNAFSGWNTRWGMTSVSDFTAPFDPKVEISNYPFYDNQYPQNKILQYTNNVTPFLAGNVDDAKQVNAPAISIPRALGYMNATKHIPIISVDFYKYPSTNGKPDIIDLCDHINGVGNYAGKPLWELKN